MKPRISVLTLGVQDLERAMAFYRDGMGLETEGIFGQEFEGGAVVFFNLSGGLILALWTMENLVKEGGVTPGDFPRSSLGHNVRTREEVDAVMAQAEAAGATITAPAEDRVWGGYSGYFQDLDGHLWEVIWNPMLLPED
jgi:catechol 2,3-dioxygenase-like lactoylglutathione lyase family enzyme